MTNNERKECISALRQLLAMCDFVDQYGDCIDADPYFDAVETAIESLNETGWIPVSERLPETTGEYLVTVLSNPSKNTIPTTAFYYNLRKEFGRYKADFSWEKWDVVAWMLLPEPYREDGE